MRGSGMTGDAARTALGRAGPVAFVFCAYLIAAWGTGNLYPFSVFPMYARSYAPTISRLVVTDANGDHVAYKHFARYACEPSGHPCVDEPPADSIGYVDRRVLDGIARRSGEVGDDAEQARVVRYTWDLRRTQRDPVAACPVLTCRAAP